MNMHIKALSIAGAFAFGILLSLPMAAQGPTFIDPVSVVESDNVDSVMVAEWLVTNATENAMTLYVERNVLQSVDPLNLPYETGAEGAYERFCWGGTCYPYGSASSVVGLALTLNPGDTTGINAFGAEDWMISDYYPNGVAGATALEYCFKATEQGVPTVCHTVLFCAATEPGECVLSVNEPQGLQLGALAPIPWWAFLPCPVGAAERHPAHRGPDGPDPGQFLSRRAVEACGLTGTSSLLPLRP